MQDGIGQAVAMGFVERKSGLLLASKQPVRTAQPMFDAASKVFSSFPAHLLLTLTVANGKENACHREIEKALGFRVYFANPGCAWQKGSVGNVFGLLRQDMPKKSNLAGYTAKQLDQFVDALNDRPRKRLGYQTPREAFLEAMCRT